MIEESNTESNRKLAHIELIGKAKDIPGKDRIVLREVLGWEVICSKEEFNEGDKCIYIEIDSLVPNDDPRFAFLEKRKYKVQTLKMASCYSQGLCLPLDKFPEVANCKVGDDVTEVLKIKKVDQQSLRDRASTVKQTKLEQFMYNHKLTRPIIKWIKELNKIKSGFPTHLVDKTDEERIQNKPWLLKELAGQRISITEKLDGSSATYIVEKNKKYIPFLSKKYFFYVASRNMKLNMKISDIWTDIAKRYNLETVLTNFLKEKGISNGIKSIALQGEIVGPGIQKNKYKLNETEFYVFNIICNTHEGRIKLSNGEIANISKSLRLKSVPMIGEISKDEGFSVQDLVEISMSETSKVNVNTVREGIVCRCRFNEEDISFKVINPDFLVKNDE